MSLPATRPSSIASRRPFIANVVSTSSTQNLRAQAPADSDYHEPDQGAAKRKRMGPESTADDLLRATIVLKPHPSDLKSQPRILSPLMLLPREHLSLSSLDLANPNGLFPAARFYESNVKILELEGRLGSNILLARSDIHKMTYAVERESKGLYTVCKLGAWVDISQLAELATAADKHRIRSLRPPQVKLRAPVPVATVQLHHENKKRRLAIEELQSIVRRRPRSQGSISTPTLTSQDSSAKPNTADSISTSLAAFGPEKVDKVEATTTSLFSEIRPAESRLVPDLEPQQPRAEELFANVRAQYMELLYHSMGSLAYFAKGPLSRARAAFHLDCDAELDMKDLIGFLKGLIVTTVSVDKKYRETIPEIIANMKTLIEDSDAAQAKARKRKSKKVKLSKNGLYTGEDEHVRRWWSAHKPATTTEDDRMMTPEEIKYHISCLRRRETQLQMILILEVLALETLRPTGDQAEASQLPRLDSSESQGVSVALTKPTDATPKKRNKHNLPFLLDIHADRLCIWQSTTLEDVKALAESQMTLGGHAGHHDARQSSEPLVDFCVDIILPFFSSRLPDLCDSINRKLGGPTIKPPPKPVKAGAAAKTKPRVPAKRSTPSSKKAKERSLEEFLSREKMRRSVSRGPDAVALLRAASMPLAPGLKREASEPVLSAVPRSEMGLLKETSQNITKKSQGADTDGVRTNKQARIDAELQDAISALKKPNRAIVSKEITAAAQVRASVGSLKKLKKPSRPSATPMVQVKATPANNRFKDMVGNLTAHGSDPEDFDRLPPSSVAVPATVARKQRTLLFGPGVVAATPRTNRIQATPSAILVTPCFPLGSVPEDEDILSLSPTMGRKVAPRGCRLSVPAPPRPDFTMPSSPLMGRLFDTPIKSSSTTNRFRDKYSTLPESESRPMGTATITPPESSDPPATEAPAAAKPVNIFQQLGWDDDDDLL